MISTNENAIIEIFDINGRKVASTRGTSLSTSTLPAGLYIIRATTPSTIKNIKIIIK